MGWAKNPQLVLDFYNARRQQLHKVVPNAGHFVMAEMEKYYTVQVVTQNVDDLHERAGSSDVLHLHGELFKVRSVRNQEDVREWRGDLHLGDTNEKGEQLRPHIVWFGEMVPAMEEATFIAQKADAFVIVGTSMQVYPAAGLIDFLPKHVPVFYVDPNPVPLSGLHNKLEVIPLVASEGMFVLMTKLAEFFK
jgi:NAD-dependent deacetylase